MPGLAASEAWRGTIVPESVQVTQLGRGDLAIDRSAVDLGPIRALSGSSSVGYKGRSELIPGRTVLGVLGDPRTDARWYGEQLRPGDIFQSNSSMDLTTHGPSKMFYVAVDTATLEPNDGRRLHRNPIYAEGIRACLKMATKAAPVTDNVPLAERSIQNTVLTLLALALNEESVFAGSPSFNRRIVAVRRCEEFVHEHIVDNPTLAQLSQISGLRTRSLINAFQAVIGMSPMTYLRVKRLNEAHNALLRLDPDNTRVIDVAATWGFWHMGHFSESYRAMFGEAPSATLNRRR